MKKIKSGLLISIITGLFAIACSQPQHQALYDDSGSQPLPPHAIHDAQLRELMDRMDSLMSERFMTETQLDSERRKYAQRIAVAAQGVSETVSAIIAKMPALTLSASDQTVFLALANKLYEQNRLLYEQASRNQADAAEKSLYQINATCTTCHALFRKPVELIK